MCLNKKKILRIPNSSRFTSDTQYSSKKMYFAMVGKDSDVLLDVTNNQYAYYGGIISGTDGTFFFF